MYVCQKNCKCMYVKRIVNVCMSMECTCMSKDWYILNFYNANWYIRINYTYGNSVDLFSKMKIDWLIEFNTTVNTIGYFVVVNFYLWRKPECLEKNHWPLGGNMTILVYYDWSKKHLYVLGLNRVLRC